MVKTTFALSSAIAVRHPNLLVRRQFLFELLLGALDSPEREEERYASLISAIGHCCSRGRCCAPFRSTVSVLAC
jgi:hypothetical protein